MKIKLDSKALVLLFLKLSYLGVLAVYLLDVYFYSGFVSNNLVPPWAILGVVLASHLVIRYKFGTKLADGFVVTNLFYLLPISLLLALIAYFLEEFGMLFPNYFFTNFRLHYLGLPGLALPALAFGLIHAQAELLANKWRHFYLMLSAGLILLAGLMFYHDEKFYRSLVIEDGVVEWITALGFVASSILALLMIKRRSFFRAEAMRKVFTYGSIVMAFLFFVVAGEEISWGQRIVGLETPEVIAERNHQDEINLHNSEWLWPYVYPAYAFVGLYGMLMWIMRWIIQGLISFDEQWRVWLKILVPGPHLFLSFGMIVFYVWLRNHHGPWKYQLWEEYAEMLLVMGLVAHLLEVYLTFPKNSKRGRATRAKS